MKNIKNMGDIEKLLMRLPKWLVGCICFERQSNIDKNPDSDVYMLT